MNKEEILKRLKETASNSHLRFPSDLELESNDGVLTISISSKGLEGNMQNDDSAFEGWAIAIKAIEPEIAKSITIQWNGIGLGEGTMYNHYRRFLYRLLRFKQSYEWASFMPLDKQAESDMENVISELPQWVVNYPVTNSQDKASTPEALLEREIISLLPGFYDHQLPVGLFYKTKSEKTRRTPGGKSQIDLWSVEGDTLNVYELKTDVNNQAGIISELMFYTNIMKDLVSGTIKYDSGADSVTRRSFNKLYSAICSKQISKVAGVFLTNDLHSILQIELQKLFDILNENTRNIQYKQVGLNSESLYDIIK